MKTYKNLVKKLKPNQIFVFGSNTQGRHGKGSALFAKQNFGAIYGQSQGLQGQSYAIVTKNLNKNIHPSISSSDIIEQIKKLYLFAKENPEKEFIIAYSGTKVNLNGYSNQEMANMFSNIDIPKNIIFEYEFSKLLKNNK
jgi:hypothetical protein